MSESPSGKSNFICYMCGKSNATSSKMLQCPTIAPTRFGRRGKTNYTDSETRVKEILKGEKGYHYVCSQCFFVASKQNFADSEYADPDHDGLLKKPCPLCRIMNENSQDERWLRRAGDRGDHIWKDDEEEILRAAVELFKQSPIQDAFELWDPLLRNLPQGITGLAIRKRVESFLIAGHQGKQRKRSSTPSKKKKMMIKIVEEEEEDEVEEEENDDDDDEQEDDDVASSRSASSRLGGLRIRNPAQMDNLRRIGANVVDDNGTWDNFGEDDDESDEEGEQQKRKSNAKRSRSDDDPSPHKKPKIRDVNDDGELKGEVQLMIPAGAELHHHPHHRQVAPAAPPQAPPVQQNPQQLFDRQKISALINNVFNSQNMSIFTIDKFGMFHNLMVNGRNPATVPIALFPPVKGRYAFIFCALGDLNSGDWAPMLLDALERKAYVWPSVAQRSDIDDSRFEYICEFMANRFFDFPNPQKFTLVLRGVAPMDTQAWTCYCLLNLSAAIECGLTVDEMTPANDYSAGLEATVVQTVGNEIARINEMAL